MASLGLHGVGVSRGIAIGRAYLFQRSIFKIREQTVAADQLDAEVLRFQRALEGARQQLHQISQKIPASTPVDIASFIDTHLLMMGDKAISEEPKRLIREHACNAEWALRIQRDALVKVFDAMDDPYLRTRKDDVDHVINRIQRLLNGGVDDGVQDLGLKGRVIIADDLSPADTVVMQHEGVAAFVTEYGGPTSHTTILARSLGIPAVVGVRNVLRYVRQGELLLIDGDQGAVIADPDSRTLASYEQYRQVEKQHQQSLELLREQPAISRDGVAVSLQANIELHEDIDATVHVGAKGVGLYRTEFLFMNRDALPDEEEQYQAYAGAVRDLKGAKLTIRTLDSGADKALNTERRGEPRGAMTLNPALGLRAIRLCLRDPGVFKPQIRAILRASAHGAVNMMLPMLTSLQEVKQAKILIEQAKQELRDEGLAFDESMPVGGMIEVPAAALSAHVFAKHLDFLSIGTNDLTQYTLAADRLDNLLDYLYQQLHPAVLMLIDLTIKAGRQSGIPVSMCGEMAGELRYTTLLLGLGLREFSMQPNMVPELKRLIQSIDIAPLALRVREALASESAVELEAFIEQLNKENEVSNPKGDLSVI